MAAHRYFIPRCFRHFLAALPPGRAEARRARAAAHRVSRRLRAAAGAGVRRTRIDSVVVGALRRETAMAPLSQVELLYCLPPALRRAPGADPAPILAEIAAMLEGLSPDAAASADGTAVLVATGGRRVRVIPAIETGDGAFAVPGPGGDGWVELSPLAEAIRLRAVDQATGRKATHLILMAEAWRRHTGAPIEPHALELLATEFVSRWADRYGDRFFYDWMARDFFGWLATQGGRALALPGCGRCIAAGRAWVFHAARAWSRAARLRRRAGPPLPRRRGILARGLRGTLPAPVHGLAPYGGLARPGLARARGDLALACRPPTGRRRGLGGTGSPDASQPPQGAGAADPWRGAAPRRDQRRPGPVIHRVIPARHSPWFAYWGARSRPRVMGPGE